MAKPSPAMRRILVHMQETGALLPEDGLKTPQQTVDRMQDLGWIRPEAYPDGRLAWFLTKAGEAAYPWPGGGTGPGFHSSSSQVVGRDIGRP